MSTLKVNTIRHTGASSDAVTLATDGTCTAKITNQPPGNRNKIVNGAMTINQRNHSGAAGNNAYTLDRWKYQRSANAEFDVVQSTEQAPGFANCLRLDCTTGNGTVGAGDYVKLRYHLEGFDVQDFAKGTASAKKFALSFYVKTSTTGVYSVSLVDENSRMVTGTYTVSDTNWNRYSIIFPADTTGTCANDNSAELSIEFNIIAGSNRTSGTDLRTAWGTYATASEAVGHTANPGSSASNNVYITGVQLEVGDVATDFEHRSYGDELRRCQRYYFEIQANDGTGLTNLRPMGYSNNTLEIIPNFPVPLRSTPTLTWSGTIKCRSCTNSITETTLTLGGSSWEAPANNITTGHMWATASSGTPFLIGYTGRILSGASPSSVNFSAEL